MSNSEYFLYVKTHNKTGLKYLGRTKYDPFVYKGSDKHWKRHLKKYGYDVATEIIGAFDTLDDLKVAGLFWSNYWNVVESDEWANCIPESGEGFEGHHSEQTKQILKEKRKLQKPTFLNKHHTQETKEKIAISLKGNIPTNKGIPLTPEQYLKSSKTFFKKGQTPWNKGLTKKDHLSIQSIATKASIRQRGQISPKKGKHYV